MDAHQQLRKQLIKHLEGGEAFTPIDVILDEMPFDKAGIIPEGLPYSFWQQLYHLRFAQFDILDFSRNPGYTAREWPADYWPPKPAPKDEQEWKDTITGYFEERRLLAAMLSDPNHDLLKPIPHGTGQTLLREVLLVIEHTAYHTGQMLIILRLLGLHR